MKRAIAAGLLFLLLAPTMAGAQKPQSGVGSEEFGMTQHELVKAVEKTEQLIASCMREQGFQYIAADFKTVRAGMMAVKRLPGLSEAEFAKRHGLGISTLYTGLPPQLGPGHSPQRVGLGERNVEAFRALSGKRIRSASDRPGARSLPLRSFWPVARKRRSCAVRSPG